MNKNVLLILLAVLILGVFIDYQFRSKGIWKKIVLPKSCQHIFSKIPLFEHFDDGNLNQKAGYTDFRNLTAVPTDELEIFLSTLPEKERSEFKWKDSGKGYSYIYRECWDKYRQTGAILTGDFSFATTEEYSKPEEIDRFFEQRSRLRSEYFQSKVKYKKGRYGTIEKDYSEAYE